MIKCSIFYYKPMCVLVTQSSPTLCDPKKCSPPGSSIHGIFQARILKWVVISFSNAWKWKVKVKSLSRVRLFATPWSVAHQAPPSMGFSWQEHWSGVPLPSPMALMVSLKTEPLPCSCARSFLFYNLHSIWFSNLRYSVAFINSIFIMCASITRAKFRTCSLL